MALRARGASRDLKGFVRGYIAEVTGLWTPLSLPVVPLHFMNHVVGQGGLLAAFWSQTHVFSSLELFFEESGAWEA